MVRTSAKGLSSADQEAKDVANLRADAGAVQTKLDDTRTHNESEFAEASVKDAERDAIDAKPLVESLKQRNSAAKTVTAAIVKFKPDPPIDGLLHSVQFVVAYGGSVTPNWTFLAWKGPGITLPAASASGVRTHILNIALGAPGKEGERLIQNQTVLNALSHP